MVQYIKSDLDFILAQIKVAEKHAAYVANPLDPNAAPLYGTGAAGQVGSVPTYTLSVGLRTVDGSDNNLLPGQQKWGAADQQFPELVDPVFRPADGTLFDPDGPGPAPAMPTQANYNPSNNPNSLVFDSSLRTISNLIVDMTLGNPSAILKGLQVGGVAEASLDNLALVQAIYAAFKPASDAEYQARVVMQSALAAANALSDGDPLTEPSPAEAAALAVVATATAAHDVTVLDLQTARDARDLALEPYGIAMDGDNVQITNPRRRHAPAGIHPMFCGTLAAQGGVRPTGRFEFELEDPVLGRVFRHGYSVRTLPIFGRASRSGGRSSVRMSGFARQRTVDRTLLGNLDEPRALGLVERADELEAQGDAVDLRLRVFAVDAVVGIDALVAQPHDHLVDRPFLPVGVHAHGHRGAAAERHQQELVGARPGIAAADRDGLVGAQRVAPVEENLLVETGAGRRHDHRSRRDRLLQGLRVSPRAHRRSPRLSRRGMTLTALLAPCHAPM